MANSGGGGRLVGKAERKGMRREGMTNGGQAREEVGDGRKSGAGGKEMRGGDDKRRTNWGGDRRLAGKTKR